MNHTCTAAGIAQAMERTARMVKLRATKENWPCRERPNPRGGEAIKEFFIDGLPPEVRQAVEAWEFKREAAAARQQLKEQELARRLQEAPRVLALPEPERRVALARRAVLAAAAEFCLSRPGPRLVKLQEFYGRLNAVLQNRGREIPSGGLGAIYKELEDLCIEPHEVPEVLACIKRVSWKTAYRWEWQQETGVGLCSLGRGYHRKTDGTYEAPGLGVKTVTADMKAYVTALFWKGQVKLWPKQSAGGDACATRPKLDCNRALIYRRLSAGFAQHAHLPHPNHFNKWLNSFLYQNQEKLAAICLPSFWRAAFQPAGGLASEQADYFGERWEIDGTPADVMFADGRHEVLAAVDIFSRDALVEVEKHATSLTVAKLFRQGFLAWGVPEWIIGDRGTIFKSQHIRTACAQMGIAQRDCDAYAPWQKPHVERFFGSMARMLFEALPWFIGHNPAQRKRIEEFSRFYEVFYHRRNPVKISCEATAAEFKAVVNDWLEKVYRAETHRFKDVKVLGRSGLVWERQANSPKRAPRIASEEHLDDLLAPAFKRVFASGVTWEGAHYKPDTPDAVERAQKFQAKPAIFKPSLADVTKGTLWELKENGQAGEFVCRLDSRLRGGMGLEDHIRAKKSVVKAHKANRRLAEGVHGPMGYDRQLAQMPKPKVAVAGFGAPDYDGEAYRNLQDHDDRYKFRLVPDTARDDRIAQGAEVLTDLRREREQALEELKNSPEVQEYVAVVCALEKGEPIDRDQRQIMRWFELTETYRRLEGWIKEKRMQAAQERWDG